MISFKKIFENLISEYYIEPNQSMEHLEDKLEFLGEYLSETNVLKSNFINGFDLWKARSTPVTDTYVVTIHKQKRTLIGYISILIENHSIAVIYVKKDYRNKGIATALYKFLLDKYKEIRSDIEISNNALNLWTKEIPKFANVYLEKDGNIIPLDKINPMIIDDGTSRLVAIKK